MKEKKEEYQEEENTGKRFWCAGVCDYGLEQSEY